ncbi:FtsW/RodA/SpoVE family cell cycle protein [Lacticaseibacillus zhaodongensis]|uniref:FtsW/RodA/SpoVE family cell cycle protein n=1 Tax=Lacticaseibacillus zhaodongensis TaxID=2668065 RepID=UPI0012D2AA9E|nr:FtsW/RodA/SpoVE family cell cycle protein [Lacticaseibacillus zhaodongensis]
MSWKLRHIDYFVLVPYAILCVFSVIMVYSASGEYIQLTTGQAPTTYLIRQSIFVVLGFLLVAFTFFFKMKHWRNPRLLFVMLIVTIGLLMYLIVKGHIDPSSAINGASAWIPVGPFNIQPSEIAKIVVIMYLAHILAAREKVIGTYNFVGTVRNLRQPLSVVLFIIVLVLLQPDTGGMAILLLIMAVMFIASGFPLRTSLITIALGGGFIGGAYYLLVTRFSGFIAKWYQGRRLLAVLHPFKLEAAEGKQLVNSLYAISHGGLFGVGLGNGTIKLGYLPEPYTDFILSVITEELGIIGAITVVGMLFFLIWRIILIGIRARSAYHTLLMYGIAMMLFAQTLFNVGAVVGVLPITGVTLPFISYGGSSLLVLSVSIGLVLNVSAREKHQREIEGSK